ncbi:MULTISPECIES: ATP-binding protein [unclassified Lysobacter]|uniref:ATP-binding protein n=1 Tax=unclassified Lysobacter TaxID=2635362 RepID=UPI0006FD929F|nr:MULTISPECIES: ATP-binding protein [unclassified Lysobacter]KRC34862.1 hypothetical protein ASE10_09240 [Lysobacter sp. Root76]KRD70551.1 hypothetical protein ASE45_01410 [Lysobacter sp. Root96]
MSETFICPRHGDYLAPEAITLAADLRTIVPLAVKRRARCTQCVADADAAKQEAQKRYEIDLSRWRRWEAAEVPYRYRNRTLGNWKPSQDQQQAFRLVDAWAADIRSRYDAGEGLLVMGPPGVGKTHLLAGLVSAVIGAGFKARYASWPEAWARCRPPFDGSPELLFRELMNVDFLALDEIGIRSGTPKEQERLFELIDYRYSRALPMLVATNLTASELLRVGERTADRLREACTGVVLTGSSKRQEAAEDEALRRAPDAHQEPAPPSLRLLKAVDGQDEEEQWRARQAA